jgi:hypothetical protein
VAKGLRSLHNEELHNVCASTNIVRVMKSKYMRLRTHVTHMGR